MSCSFATRLKVRESMNKALHTDGSLQYCNEPSVCRAFEFKGIPCAKADFTAAMPFDIICANGWHHSC